MYERTLPRPTGKSLLLVVVLSFLCLCSLAPAPVLRGRFLIPSHLGYKNILLVVHFNYIHFVPLMSRTSASYLTAYRSVAKFFSSLFRSHRLLPSLDNEICQNSTSGLQCLFNFKLTVLERTN